MIRQTDDIVQFGEDPKRLKSCQLRNWIYVFAVGIIVVMVGGVAGFFVGKKSVMTDQDSVDSGGNLQSQWAALEGLEILGLRFFLDASNSACNSKVCRTCTTEVYKDDPAIEPEKPCNDSGRTINESCWKCTGRGTWKCYNFQQALNYNGSCDSPPVCGELTMMADLNKYCNEGHAIFDNNKRNQPFNVTLSCACPHGRTGNTCGNESEKGRVLCRCFNHQYELLESLPEFQISSCENASYNSTTKCIHSTKDENCYCVFTEDSAVLNSTPSCDISDNNGSGDHQMGKQINNAAVERNSIEHSMQIIVFAFLGIAMSKPS